MSQNLKKLLAELVELARKYGPDSKEVDNFARKHNDNITFLKLAATILFLMEN